MNKQCNIPLGKMVAFLFLVMIWAAVPMVMADQTSESEAKATREGNQSGMELVKEKITIEKKSKQKVVSKFGDAYAVSKATLILGVNGQQVSIYEMLVPCTAEITYRMKNGVKETHRIHMQHVLSNASNQLTYEKPE